MIIRMNAPNRGRAMVALMLLPVLALGGCGFYKNWQVGKKNQEVETLLANVQSQQADRYLPDDFDKARRALEDSRAAAEASNYEEAFGRSDEAKALLEQIDARLPQVRADVQAKQSQLTDIQVHLTEALGKIRSYAPEEATLIESASRAVASASELLQAPKQVAQGDQGYDAILEKAKAALSEATAGLARIEKDKAEKGIAALEDAWRQAQGIEVPKYAPESVKIPQAIDVGKALIASASYQTVLNQVPMVQAELQRFTVRAREARAKARIEHAQRLIDLASEEPDASEEKINEAKTALDEAIAQSRDAKFDEAFASAEKALNTARSEVKALEDEILQNIADLSARIEESHKWETERISEAKFTQAVADRDKAQDLAREILFNEARNAIESGSDAIEEAIGEARTVKLAVRIREDETSLQATEERGTYLYLKEDYQAIQGLIENATAQVDTASYDEAEATLAKAEQMILGLETGLRTLAQQRVSEVEAVLKEAKDAGAEKNAPELLEDASTALADALASAAKAEWKETIEACEGALTKSREAAQQSYKIVSEELLPVAEKEIENAKTAGAASYAAEVYNRALDALDQSRKAYQAAQFKEALQKVTQSRDEAVLARRHLVERAQAAVNSAIEAKAQEYDTDTIAAALVDLADAKSLMEQGQFESSREKALSAEQKAQSAEVKTWNLRAQAAIAHLKERVDSAEAHQAPAYAGEEFRKVSTALLGAEGLFGSQKFEEAYRQADSGEADADKVFAKLEEQAGKVRGEYDALVNKLKTFVQDPFGVGLHSEATMRLGAIDQAIARKDWGGVFSLYREGTQTVDKAIVATKIHNINTQKAKLEQLIAVNEQQGLFKLTKISAEQMRGELAKVVFDPALDRLKPEVDYYREGVRALAKVESDLGRIREMAVTEADSRITRIRTDIDNAREIGARDMPGGAFDGAIDSYEKARDMVVLLRNPIDGVPPTDFNQLAQQIAAAESEATKLNQMALAQRSTTDYLRDLIVWTYDMTKFLDQWYPVEALGYQMIIQADLTSDMYSYRIAQMEITPRKFLSEAESLYDRVKVVSPPPAMSALHEVALECFATFVKSADGFYRYGLFTRYPKRMRERYLIDAYTSLERLHAMNETMITMILKQVRVYGLTDFERDLSNELSAFSTYLRRDRTAG